MAESRLRKIVEQFLEDVATDVVEERVVDYIVREVHAGRKLAAVLEDPYVRNRLTEERLAHILENKEIIETVQQEMSLAFERGEFGFKE